MNELSNVIQFIHFWDESKNPHLSSVRDFARSPLDNINYKGDCISDTAVILLKRDPLFYASIEEGIKPLVFILVEKFNWITFSSCSGHRGFNGHSYKKRMVQLLPRDQAEENKITRILNQSIIKTNSTLLKTKNPIWLLLYNENLNSEQLNYNSIKLVFDSNSISEQSYFIHIDIATKVLLKQLENNFKDYNVK